MNGTRLIMSLLLVAFPALVLPVVRKTRRPRWWTMVISASLGAGFVLLEVSLIHAALPAVFTLLGMEELAAACRTLGGHLFGATPAFAAVASVVVIITGVKAVLGGVDTLRIQASLRQGAAQGHRTDIAGQETVLLPLRHHWAMAVPGASPQIVISETLMATLAAHELKAVVRHEMAHVRHNHLRFLLLGSVVGSGLWFLPWLPRATRALTLSLERWADEDASSGSSKGREEVRSALRRLSQVAPSALARDRITALETTSGGREETAALSWSAAASVVVPLAFALALTLVHHLLQVIEIAAAAGG